MENICIDNKVINKKQAHICEFCGKELLSKQGYVQHKSYCKLNPNRVTAHICEFCGKELINKGAYVCHTLQCKLNPNKITFNYPVINGRKLGKLKGKIYPSPFKGKKYQDIYGEERTKEIIKKLKKSLTGKLYNISEEKNKKRIEKIKETAKRYHRIGGYRHGSGRGKKGWYKGYFCDSTWELAYVIYNLEHDIKFKRNTIGFEYEFNNQIHKYYPDFILDDGTYVEIKGYLNPKDLKTATKIALFQKKFKLLIIDKYKIKPYIDYVAQKYNKQLDLLYENRKDV